MRVLLAQPRQKKHVGYKNVTVVEPLGLESVGGGLGDEHEVRLVDLFDEAALREAVRRFDPGAVGISCTFTIDTYQARSIASIVKDEGSDPFVFVGGHHASLSPKDFYVPEIDAVVVGEGEVTTRELVGCLERGDDPRQVAGLVINGPEGQVMTPAREQVADMDSLPYPDRGLAAPYRRRYFHGIRRPLATVETARGCPYDCRFCSVWRFYGRKVRFKSAERVADEISRLDEREVLITDDNFLCNVSRAIEIAELLERNGVRKHFIVQGRSDTIVQHPEVIDAWRGVGLEGVFIGFEKVDDEGLESVNKRNSAMNNEKALEILRRRGVGVYASFIVDPWFRIADFRRLREYIRKLRIEMPYFTILTPLPGTVLFKKMKQKIVTKNYELFDLFHTVLPTDLPLRDFYREFARLYGSTYLNPTRALNYLASYVKWFLQGRLSITHLMHILVRVRHIAMPEKLLADHGRA